MLTGVNSSSAISSAHLAIPSKHPSAPSQDLLYRLVLAGNNLEWLQPKHNWRALLRAVVCFTPWHCNRGSKCGLHLWWHLAFSCCRFMTNEVTEWNTPKRPVLFWLANCRGYDAPGGNGWRWNGRATDLEGSLFNAGMLWTPPWIWGGAIKESWEFHIFRSQIWNYTMWSRILQQNHRKRFVDVAGCNGSFGTYHIHYIHCYFLLDNLFVWHLNGNCCQSLIKFISDIPNHINSISVVEFAHLKYCDWNPAPSEDDSLCHSSQLF